VARHPAVRVSEHGDALQASAERFEVPMQRRPARVVGVLELGDRRLRHVELAGELERPLHGLDHVVLAQLHSLFHRAFRYSQRSSAEK